MPTNFARVSHALLMVAVFASWNIARADDRLGLPPVPVPANNPMTPEKIALGKVLFMDSRFSGDGTISCASCHMPGQAFADGQPVGQGIRGQKGTRNSPTVVNSAYYTSLFWDGRADSLEAQAKGPLLNPIEHGLKSYEPILAIVRKDKSYSNQFKRVFGVEPAGITIDHVAMAIAGFERTVVAGDSPFDRYQYGDGTALPAAAMRGLQVFAGKGMCTECHLIGKTSALFTDNSFHNIGVGSKKIESRLTVIVNTYVDAKVRSRTSSNIDQSVLSGDEISQLGRFAITLNPADLGNFRTPTLRNIALTAPYMHDGSLKTLEDVVEFYGRGGSKSSLQHSTIRDLRLSKEEQRDLVQFMKSLTSPQLVPNQRQAAK